MGKSGRRALVLRPDHLATPDGDAVAHAARRELEPKIRPIECVGRVVEARLAVEAVEIGADELAVFNANPDSIEAHERARFASGMPSLVSRDDIRDPADHRMLYVLGFSIAGAIVTNALVFLY